MRFSITIIFLVFVINGCSRPNEIDSENGKGVQTRTEITEVKPTSIPQIELVESPKYKELKKQAEEIQNEVIALENQQTRLLAIYTEEFYQVKKVSKDLKKARNKLRQIEDLLADELEKLEYRAKSNLV